MSRRDNVERNARRLLTPEVVELAAEYIATSKSSRWSRAPALIEAVRKLGIPTDWDVFNAAVRAAKEGH